MKSLVLFLAVLFCSAICFAQKNGSIDYKLIGAPMPSMRLVVPQDLNAATLSGEDKKKIAKLKTKTVMNADLSKTNNTIVMLFLPTCDHCQDQARMMKDSISAFRNTKVLLMAAPNMIPYLEFFDQSCYISKYPETFLMGVDSADFINSTYLKEMTPQINIYSPAQKLLKTFIGGAPLDSLRKYLN